MKLKTLFVSTVVLAALVLAPSKSSAQFTDKSFMVGPHIGFVGYAGGGLAFGAIAEKGIVETGKLGPGFITIQGRLDYYSFGDAYWSYTFITVGAFAQYHYPLDNKNLDPFAGLGLAYEHVSVSGPGTSLYASAWGSGIGIWGDAGIRYFLSPNMALRAQLGFGATWLVVGVDFGV